MKLLLLAFLILALTLCATSFGDVPNYREESKNWRYFCLNFCSFWLSHHAKCRYYGITDDEMKELEKCHDGQEKYSAVAPRATGNSRSETRELELRQIEKYVESLWHRDLNSITSLSKMADLLDEVERHSERLKALDCYEEERCKIAKMKIEARIDMIEARLEEL